MNGEEGGWGSTEIRGVSKMVGDGGGIAQKRSTKWCEPRRRTQTGLRRWRTRGQCTGYKPPEKRKGNRPASDDDTSSTSDTHTYHNVAVVGAVVDRRCGHPGTRPNPEGRSLVIQVQSPSWPVGDGARDVDVSHEWADSGVTQRGRCTRPRVSGRVIR